MMTRMLGRSLPFAAGFSGSVLAAGFFGLVCATAIGIGDVRLETATAEVPVSSMSRRLKLPPIFVAFSCFVSELSPLMDLYLS